ncbi:DNA excision repair protein ERCC-8-like [Tubulanus polymorphus]|uniref:DNA excision repair protein ERCC-8-like n=1 Tax=Tubulanus polymorphus TaxID=672921 RepID=UPI003DA3AFF7
MLHALTCRESGLALPETISREQRSSRAQMMELSKYRDFEVRHRGSVVSLDLDAVESRFLLSGSSDGAFAIYDLHQGHDTPAYTYKPICGLSKYQRFIHKNSISTVQWYPLDTGMFTTTGMDGVLKIWDTNEMRPADQYSFTGVIYCHAMSAASMTHTLLAVATAKCHCVLVDLRTGAKTHTLRGHKDAVMSCQWSPKDEFILATGGSDSKLMLWDVRSAAGSLMVFDQYNGDTTANPESVNTAHNGLINGMRFLSNGLHLVSVGTDDHMRLWNVATGKNMLVNYGKLENFSLKNIQIACSFNTNPELVYVPVNSDVCVYDIFNGDLLVTLRGHYNTVNCTVFNPDTNDVYSGANDRNILLFSGNVETESAFCKHLDGDDRTENNTSATIPAAAADAWSSDEDS